MSGFVYAIQAVDGGPVKIGWADDPLKRLGQLQVAHHSELVIVRQFEALQQHERDLHEELASQRLRGEWFQDTPLLWDAVAATASDAAQMMMCKRTQALLYFHVGELVAGLQALLADRTVSVLPARDAVVSLFIESADGVATVFEAFQPAVAELVKDGSFGSLEDLRRSREDVVA